MKLKIHKLSINYLITFICMVLIPFFLFGFFINLYYGRQLIDKTKEKMTETALQVAENLDQEIRNISILSSALIHNVEFQEASRSYGRVGQSATEFYLSGKELDTHMNNLFQYTSKFGSIYIYFKNNIIYKYDNYSIRSRDIDQDYITSLEIKRAGAIRNIFNIENNFYDHTEILKDETHPLISMTIYPEEKMFGEDIIAMQFGFRLDLLKMLKSTQPEEKSIIISDSKGNILLSNQTDMSISESILSDHLNKEKERDWVISSASINGTDWQFIQASPTDILLKPILRIRLLIFFLMALILLIFILYTILFFHNIITPVNHLAESMDLVKRGEENVQVDVSGPEEMQHLQSTFNRMITQVHKLSEEKQQNQEEKNHLELQALQYQISPHFIANTLNSIRLMAVVNKNEHIKNMTASLMRLINSSFRSEGNHITLKEEMENLLSYVHIIKVRFGNRIELRFSIPEEQKDFKIRKMLLQPLVENAIIHGFQNGAQRGVILVQTCLNQDNLIVKITDNGVGMTKDERENQGNSEEVPGVFTSLGIQSVNRRIHLNYGDKYGLKIISRKGYFTSMILNLPIEKTGHKYD